MARPRKYATDAERRAAKRAQDNARYARNRDAKRERFISELQRSYNEGTIHDCCLIWALESPRHGKRCPQHQTMDQVNKRRPFDRSHGAPPGIDEPASFGRYLDATDHDNDPRSVGVSPVGDMMSDGHGVRVHPDPDSFPPLEQPRVFTGHSWSGPDAKMDKKAKTVIDRDMPLSLAALQRRRAFWACVVHLLEQHRQERDAA